MASAASSEPINILGSHHSHRGILSSSNYSLYGRGFDDTAPAPLLGDNNLSFRERRYRRLPLNSFWIASGDKDVDPKFPMRVRNLIEDSGNPDAPRQLSRLLQSEQGGHWLARVSRAYDPVEWAAKAGNYGCLQIITQSGYMWGPQTVLIAARSSSVDTLRFSLLGSGPLQLHGVEEVATPCARPRQANPESEDDVQQLRPYDFSAFNAALVAGHLPSLILLDECTFADFPHIGDDRVARPGWAQEFRRSGAYPWSCELLRRAAEKGNVATLEFALAHGCPRDPRIAAAAASRGQLPVLEKLREFGHSLGWQVLMAAVYSGNIACVEFALEECGKERLPGVLAFAASCGDMCIVRFLLAKGFPLWTHAEEPESAHAREVAALWKGRHPGHPVLNGIFPLPGYHMGLGACWAAMRFCKDLGAPLPPSGEAHLEVVRKHTRTVLLSFHAATRLAQGNKEHGPALAAMGVVPHCLVHHILVLAGLELKESMPVNRKL